MNVTQRYKLNFDKSVWLLGLLLFVVSCATDPGFDNVPEITFLDISKDTLIQDNLNTDSLFMRITFKDGDGDLGTENQNFKENIIVTDLRTGVISNRFNIPPIANGGLNSGIEGEITMKIFTTCCIFPDGTPPCQNPADFPTNALSFEIEMIDDKGNRSNKVTTSVVTLLCN